MNDKLRVEIDYIAEEPELDPMTLQFSKVFDAFRAAQIIDEKNLRGAIDKVTKQEMLRIYLAFSKVVPFLLGFGHVFKSTVRQPLLLKT